MGKYCKNCKYKYYEKCGKDNEHIKNKYTGKNVIIEHTTYTSNYNSDGDCEYYKRKWWKFWI